MLIIVICDDSIVDSVCDWGFSVCRRCSVRGISYGSSRLLFRRRFAEDVGQQESFEEHAVDDAHDEARHAQDEVVEGRDTMRPHVHADEDDDERAEAEHEESDEIAPHDDAVKNGLVVNLKHKINRKQVRVIDLKTLKQKQNVYRM